MDNVRSINDLMTAATNAMLNGDEATLEDLKAVAGNWLQPTDEMEAQLNMLDGMLEMVERA